MAKKNPKLIQIKRKKIIHRNIIVPKNNRIYLLKKYNSMIKYKNQESNLFFPLINNKKINDFSENNSFDSKKQNENNKNINNLNIVHNYVKENNMINKNVNDLFIENNLIKIEINGKKKDNYIITKKNEITLKGLNTNKIAIQNKQLKFKSFSFNFNLKNKKKKENNIINDIYFSFLSNKNSNKKNLIKIEKIKNLEIINDKNKINYFSKIVFQKIINISFPAIKYNKNEKSTELEKIKNFLAFPKINSFNKIANSEKYLPKGLVNFTLNCYMNSLLQCFYYIPEFRNFFLSNNFEKSNTMCESLKDLMIGLNKQSKYKYFKPTKIKNEIKKQPIFCDGKGADVTDLLSLIFDKITNELEKEESSQVTVKYQTKVDDKKIMFEDLYNEIDFKNIIINKLFVGFYEKEYKCDDGHVKYSFQNEYRIIFPLEEISQKLKKNSNLTLYDCFDYYQRPQINNNIKKENNNDNNDSLTNIDKESENDNSENYNESDNSDNTENNLDNLEKCYKCGNNCILTEKIYRTPKILIIILDRGPNKKYDKKVEFSKNINLKKYMDDKEYEFPTEYQLIGVSTHLGSSGNSGHYISICLCDDNNYYLFNDENVYKINSNKNSELYKGSAYILFYQRLDNKEKLIKKSKEKIKNYTNEIVKKLNFQNKESINYICYEEKIIFIKKNENNDIEFYCEIDFSNFIHSLDNLTIKILSEEISNVNKTQQNKRKEKIYNWDKNNWANNEEEVINLIDDCFKKLKKQYEQKYICKLF